MRRIGWLIGGAENNLESRVTRAAMKESLARLGWIEGSNLRIELRFGEGDPDRIQAHEAELVDSAPDVIVSGAGGANEAVRKQTHIRPFRSYSQLAATPSPAV
jgi:putative ABC transport system substrate-binding protein